MKNEKEASSRVASRREFPHAPLPSSSSQNEVTPQFCPASPSFVAASQTSRLKRPCWTSNSGLGAADGTMLFADMSGDPNARQVRRALRQARALRAPRRDTSGHPNLGASRVAPPAGASGELVICLYKVRGCRDRFPFRGRRPSCCRRQGLGQTEVSGPREKNKQG